MTFILTVQTKGSLWLLADRRLSALGRAPIDDARKIAIIETHDGAALIGHAGLGATALGTEPSKWISNVLRGTNVSLEQSLGLLANAMKRVASQEGSIDPRPLFDHHDNGRIRPPV